MHRPIFEIGSLAVTDKGDEVKDYNFVPWDLPCIFEAIRWVFFDGKNGHSSKSGITTLPFQQMSSSKTKQCLDNRPLKKTLSTAMFLFQSQKNYKDC